MMRRTSPSALVSSQVGISPKVVPLFGSMSISGTGMNGAVDGSNQRARPCGAGLSTESCPGALAASSISMQPQHPARMKVAARNIRQENSMTLLCKVYGNELAPQDLTARLSAG